ncbi:hypothetical protein Y032_0146g2522 [Ancylostoma ceylanicum]|uniref:Reverse transcriptase domain-containing protein n=1 Tax=Ancylostoma ceylanicum TaxID=53326 RepID=A0A016T1F2_9BILA|nr:hypothetical protein Y032_0146g2522 [Ancylostoma ceylanicum]
MRTRKGKPTSQRDRTTPSADSTEEQARQSLRYVDEMCYQRKKLSTFPVGRPLEEASGLQGKFNRLVERDRDQRLSLPVSATLSSPSLSHSDDCCEDVPALARVSVIGDVTLSEDALSLLDLGPSFSPVQSIGHGVTRKIVGSLQFVHDRLRHRASRKEQETGREHNTGTTLPPIPFPARWYNPQEPNMLVDTKFRLFTTSVFFSILTSYCKKPPISNLTPAQRRGLREIRELSAQGEIKISTSDKGGEFVIISRELDMAITKHHLEDETLYRASSAQEFARQYRHLNKVWVETAKAAGLNKATITRLKNDRPECPVLYVLIKTHKLSPAALTSKDPRDFKVRPIISVGGPTDRISWLLNVILSPLLKHVPAHLRTNMFLERLRAARVDNECATESFDVTSLYTNVSNEAALQAIFELLSENHTSLTLHGFIIRQVMMLLDECLKCAIFRWSGHYYRQIRGLAMGQRLAPTLAIAFMSKVEQPVLERNLFLYCRYIDDCCIVCSTQFELDTCFDLLNQQSPHIKFIREKPRDSWLPFLNVQVYTSKGECKTKWYRKPSSKNILVHSLSAHPRKTKKAILGNMFATAIKVRSDVQERANSIKLAQHIAHTNGYPEKEWTRKSGRLPRRRNLTADDNSKIAFCLPFISDEMSKKVRASLRKADLEDHVRVVDIPPANLNTQLVRNRLYDRLCVTPNCVICPFGKDWDCMVSGVVYLITCQSCGDQYIGETGRPLCIRIKEHLDGMAGSSMTTALGGHLAVFDTSCFIDFLEKGKHIEE